MTATVPSDSTWLEGKLDAVNVEIDAWFGGSFSILGAQPSGYEIAADDALRGAMHVRWPFVTMQAGVPFVATIVALPNEERLYVALNGLVSRVNEEDQRQGRAF
ncbi:MAG: hypothetical protein ABI780_06415, partial [Ardenticatenales bacterium]